MPSLFAIRSDIMLILGKSTQSKNFRINHSQIDYKVNEKRARGVREESARNNNNISPSSIQDMGKMNVTMVTSADDPSVPQNCKQIAKVEIPQVVDLAEDRGVYRVGSSSKLESYYPIEPSRFFDIPSDNIVSKFTRYTRIGTALYINKTLQEINVELILDNPLDGFVLHTTNIEPGFLTFGDRFTVISGNVTHNGVKYFTGNIFTAINPDYTGTGKVQYANQKRKMTINDNYPLSFTLTDYIIMKILTQDFKIEASEVADIRNDSRDQLLALQSAQQ